MLQSAFFHEPHGTRSASIPTDLLERYELVIGLEVHAQLPHAEQDVLRLLDALRRPAEHEHLRVTGSFLRARIVRAGPIAYDADVIGERRNLVRVQNGRATVHSQTLRTSSPRLGRELPERNSR